MQIIHHIFRVLLVLQHNEKGAIGRVPIWKGAHLATLDQLEGFPLAQHCFYVMV